MPKPSKLLIRAVIRRCPLCGGGNLFKRWFTMVPDCPTCTYHFEREEGFFLGAFVMSTVVTLASLMAFLAIGFAITLPDPPLVTLAIIGAVIGFAVPVIVYPFTKTLWTAVYLMMSRTMGDPWKRPVQPGFGPKR
jgi:predicted acyltransferase